MSRDHKRCQEMLRDAILSYLKHFFLIQNKKGRQFFETDDVVLNRREKQISLGKGTEHYRKYTELVEIADRDNKMPR